MSATIHYVYVLQGTAEHTVLLDAVESGMNGKPREQVWRRGVRWAREMVGKQRSGDCKGARAGAAPCLAECCPLFPWKRPGGTLALNCFLSASGVGRLY